MANREFRLDRHQRMTTRIAQLTESFNQILLPALPAIDRLDELAKLQIPPDVQIISSFMVFIDDIFLHYIHEPTKFAYICRAMSVLFNKYPKETFNALDKLFKDLVSNKKSPSKSKGYI